MRLPADATLIVVGDGPSGPPPRAGGAEERIASNLMGLIAVWRREELPLVLLPMGAASDAPPAWATFVETAVGLAGGFAGTDLESFLDESGATTLVVCGELGALEAAARDAAGLGYHVFVPFDACWPAASAADPAFQRLGGDGAAIVDTAAALVAAAMARNRQRREAQRKR